MRMGTLKNILIEKGYLIINRNYPEKSDNEYIPSEETKSLFKKVSSLILNDIKEYVQYELDSYKNNLERKIKFLKTRTEILKEEYENITKLEDSDLLLLESILDNDISRHIDQKELMELVVIKKVVENKLIYKLSYVRKYYYFQEKNIYSISASKLERKINLRKKSFDVLINFRKKEYLENELKLILKDGYKSKKVSKTKNEIPSNYTVWLLYELGIINYLFEESKFNGTKENMFKYISLFTGLNEGTLKKYINYCLTIKREKPSGIKPNTDDAIKYVNEILGK